jgi:N-acetylglucosaminyldiphosphoundecaprenol N-acetyl-beta-D-mannosaminyltransferase
VAAPDFGRRLASAVPTLVAGDVPVPGPRDRPPSVADRVRPTSLGHDGAVGGGLPFPTSLRVGGVQLRSTSLDAVAAWLTDAGRPGGPQAVRLVNAYSVALADTEPSYRRVLVGAGVNLPDGAPVLWFMRWAARHLPDVEPHRVRGPSLFAHTLTLSRGRPVSHFLLGGSPRTLARLLEVLDREFEGCTVAGSHSPPYGEITDERLDDWCERIAASGADVVWLGLGTPKQDIAAVELSRRLGVHCVGVGAAFDFLAGTRPEAPRWLQRLALEWLFRLATEPRRLWKRYIFGNAQFLCVAVSGARRARKRTGA